MVKPVAEQLAVCGFLILVGEGAIADAILCRLVYSSHRFELQGKSLRSKKQLSE